MSTCLSILFVSWDFGILFRVGCDGEKNEKKKKGKNNPFCFAMSEVFPGFCLLFFCLFACFFFSKLVYSFELHAHVLSSLGVVFAAG